jgi:hypothetical protein
MCRFCVEFGKGLRGAFTWGLVGFWLRIPERIPALPTCMCGAFLPEN